MKDDVHAEVFTLCRDVTLSARAWRAFDRLARELTSVLAGVIGAGELHHVGSTAVPGTLSNGDLDVQLRVVDDADGERCFRRILERCPRFVVVNAPPHGHSLEDDSRARPPTRLHITTADSDADVPWVLATMLREDFGLRRQDDDIKRAFEGRALSAYREARDALFAPLLKSPRFAEIRATRALSRVTSTSDDTAPFAIVRDGEHEQRYFDDSYSELVSLVGGRPVRYSSLAKPIAKKEEPALAARIHALTGRHVRFGDWIDVQGDPRDGGAEVPLLPLLDDGPHTFPDSLGQHFGHVVVVAGGEPVRFGCLGSPIDEPSAEAALANDIERLTGFRVRFGRWRETPQSVQEGGAEADLFVDD